jgi:hypothetical protein
VRGNKTLCVLALHALGALAWVPAATAQAPGQGATEQVIAPIVADAQASVDDAQAAARQAGEAEIARVTDAAKQGANEVAAEAKARAMAATAGARKRLEDSLAALESDTFSFGVFPNTAGFMDARLHARKRYWRYFSSGLYLDYTTARDTSESGTARRSDRLVKEYRAQADCLKGVWVAKELKGDTGVGLSFEPGITGTFMYQDIHASGYTKNTFDETLFQSTQTKFFSGAASARLGSSFVWRTAGRVTSTMLDASGEYIPFIYSDQSDKTVTSQFDAPVTSTVTNLTSGLQANASLRIATSRAGGYTVRGTFYRNEGKVKSSALVLDGNFEYRIETFAAGKREDLSGEFIHSMSYVKFFGALVPAVGVAYQRKTIITGDDSINADVFKIALLVETE